MHKASESSVDHLSKTEDATMLDNIGQSKVELCEDAVQKSPNASLITNDEQMCGNTTVEHNNLKNISESEEKHTVEIGLNEMDVSDSQICNADEVYEKK